MASTTEDDIDEAISSYLRCKNDHLAILKSSFPMKGPLRFSKAHTDRVLQHQSKGKDSGTSGNPGGDNNHEDIEETESKPLLQAPYGFDLPTRTDVLEQQRAGVKRMQEMTSRFEQMLVAEKEKEKAVGQSENVNNKKKKKGSSTK